MTPTTDAERLDWGALFARYGPLARRAAEGIVGQREQAEDLVQEAFRSVYERARDGAVTFASGAHARNYVLRAVHNLAVDALRSPERTLHSALGEADEAQDARPLPQRLLEEREEDERRLAAVRRALATLGSREGEALRLRYLEGLTYREMFERTRESISTLQSRVEAALDKIRGKIGKEGSPP